MNKELADLIFPNAKNTIEYYEKRQSVAIENFKKCNVNDISEALIKMLYENNSIESEILNAEFAPSYKVKDALIIKRFFVYQKLKKLRNKFYVFFNILYGK